MHFGNFRTLNINKSYGYNDNKGNHLLLFINQINKNKF